MPKVVNECLRDEWEPGDGEEKENVIQILILHLRLKQQSCFPCFIPLSISNTISSLLFSAFFPSSLAPPRLPLPCRGIVVASTRLRLDKWKHSFRSEPHVLRKLNASFCRDSRGRPAKEE
ncbi:hypothetical protein E2C01_089676 [Portunus trituberculatus]|uniref:Uncharacterized protein n=1 Tax=Portunus trituberculatus TaxID=210409 RepID=A0A5B7JIW3_PORTR|nr:hypothetical protein [Portunus trituberculatus]